MNDDEWAHWVNLEVWTLKEAILLLEEKSPKEYGFSFSEFSEFFYKTEDLAIRANMVGILQTINKKPLCPCMRYLTIDEAKQLAPSLRGRTLHLGFYMRKKIENEQSKEVGINPLVFLKWAHDNGLLLNQNLAAALDNADTNEILSKAKPVRTPAKDKIRCQTVAQLLWHDDPKRTITSIINDKKMKIFGNGSQYEDKALRRWVSEVDPRPPSEKTGRPKKKTSPDS